jgi:hypothetical protein
MGQEAKDTEADIQMLHTVLVGRSIGKGEICLAAYFCTVGIQ